MKTKNVAAAVAVNGVIGESFMHLLRVLLFLLVSCCSEVVTVATPIQSVSESPKTIERFYLHTGSDEKPFQLFTKSGAFEEYSYLRKDAKEDFRDDKDEKHLGSKYEEGKSYLVASSDNVAIDMTHFDHGKDTLIVLGHGYFSTSKRWRYVVSFLKDYDVVTFDYRWHEAGFFRQSHTIFSPMQSRFFDEKEDVVAVVQAAKKLKKYKQVIGLAECYGAFPFTMAQAAHEASGQPLFDKLILDSTFVSLRSFVDGVGRNIFKWRYLYRPILASWHLFVPGSVTITPYLAQIKTTPLLFIHGNTDTLFTIQNIMDEAFNVTKAPKALFETPYEHVQTGTDWGIYKFVCDQFIQSASQADFIERLKSTI